MIEKTLQVKLKNGLHARPVACIVKKLQALNIDESLIEYSKIIANLTSIIETLALGVDKGYSVKVKISGKDEAEAMRVIESVLCSENWNSS